jgi:Tfp pilus assembly protein PilF
VLVAACGGADDPYTTTVLTFHRGLAAMEAGLLDDARDIFETTTELAPDEPAAWANLGVAGLRLGILDEAAGQIVRAAALAPDDADVVFLLGLAESARGQVDAAVARFRETLAIDDAHLRARLALARAVERAGGPDADDTAQAEVEALLTRAPDNLVVHLERARLSAKRGDRAALDDATSELTARRAGWPETALDQLALLADAADRGAIADAARAVAFLRNVLARTPEYQGALVAVETPPDLIAEPLLTFRRLPVPSPLPSPPDPGLTYQPEALARAVDGASALAVVALDATGATAVVGASAELLQRLDGPGQWLFPGGGIAPSPAGLLPLDWNGDFRTDLVLAGGAGVRLLLQEDGTTFTDATATAWAGAAPTAGAAFGAWAADLEMDGDLDVVVGLEAGAPLVLRNNGDGAWTPIEAFTTVSGVRGMAWADLDGDGDPDPVLLDEVGAVHVFVNQQAGRFDPRPAPDGIEPWLALAAGDSNADGRLELLGLDAGGAVSRHAWAGDGWDTGAALATWPGATGGGVPGTYRLWLADLDNSGSLDLVASGGGASRAWLADTVGAYAVLPGIPTGEIGGVADLTGDGRLDLVGLTAGVPTRFRGAGELDYHWHVMRPRAQLEAGDQRINTFGVGGEAEVRTGRLVQKQLLAGGPVHFGLGTREQVDIARILWPNGVAQAEFDLGADEAVVAEQRLKGSCPWVFTWDGTQMQFVTDFLWRSPLGLRINAQDTAGVVQTEDWVRIRGDQLVPRDGVYDVRITAELWETHFIDHVSLLVVDHPVDVEVYVDERFAVPAPALEVRATAAPVTVTGAWDGTGRDVTGLVTARDGRYLDTFALGRYQGVAASEHAVEFTLGDVPADGPVWLLAYGWIYPTDSSINVAIGQGRLAPPSGLALDAQDASGQWRTVRADLGFPAGKQKTIMVDVSDVARTATRLRLRTNLEIYWDWLGHAAGRDAAGIRTTRLDASLADLGYRGYSQTSNIGPRGPEVPRYSALANIGQRWRDLEGYHTRFGDVRELLAGIDDRYVIMNAGDELRFGFDALPPPAAGWTRDFVLIGDGWVKDGDYNTSFSRTVGPLPTHARSEYVMPPDGPALEADPAYRAHPDDWERFHTRYVTPRAFLGGLFPQAGR